MVNGSRSKIEELLSGWGIDAQVDHHCSPSRSLPSFRDTSSMPTTNTPLAQTVLRGSISTAVPNKQETEVDLPATRSVSPDMNLFMTPPKVLTDRLIQLQPIATAPVYDQVLGQGQAVAGGIKRQADNFSEHHPIKRMKRKVTFNYRKYFAPTGRPEEYRKVYANELGEGNTEVLRVCLADLRDKQDGGLRYRAHWFIEQRKKKKLVKEQRIRDLASNEKLVKTMLAETILAETMLTKTMLAEAHALDARNKRDRAQILYEIKEEETTNIQNPIEEALGHLIILDQGLRQGNCIGASLLLRRAVQKFMDEFSESLEVIDNFNVNDIQGYSKLYQDEIRYQNERARKEAEAERKRKVEEEMIAARVQEELKKIRGQVSVASGI